MANAPSVTAHQLASLAHQLGDGVDKADLLAMAFSEYGMSPDADPLLWQRAMETFDELTKNERDYFSGRAPQ